MSKADNLNSLMCRLSWNLGVSTSWNPQTLSRPVQVLLYVFILSCLMCLTRIKKVKYTLAQALKLCTDRTAH